MPTRETPSPVEQLALAQSGQKLRYSPTEKIGVIVVDNFPALGKLAALRFIEWVQQNSGGVVSLPTGKTPEHFIKWVKYFLRHWDDPKARQELEAGGIDPAIKPDMKSLHFVQIDEFYPIHPQQQNSFYYYVNMFYLQSFGFDRAKALLIDCSKIGLPEGKDLDDIWPDKIVDLSLRYRYGKNSHERLQKQVLEQVDQWCVEYEEKIRRLGGIGFFLGGIGPDGHIGFNVQGSDFYSTTRLTPTNYETQAAAATDLGGIEVSRQRLVITIGLATITFNPKCTAIIIAAGEAKAPIVTAAIQENKHIHHPATVLHDLPNARFYLTRGAAKYLIERQHEILVKSDTIDDETMERLIVDLAVQKRQRLRALTAADFAGNRLTQELLRKSAAGVEVMTQKVEQRLIQKIDRGRQTLQNQVFLHTEPHHDDLMLGYLPFIVRHIRDASNQHYFITLTSGFTAVTNQLVFRQLKNLKSFLERGAFDKLVDEDYFNPENEQGRNRDVWQYLDGIAANRRSVKEEGEARRLLRNLIFIFDDNNIDNLKHRIDELMNYFETQYPGKKDLPHIQRLKGMIREWESDCLWGYFGFNSASVMHARLGFYKGDIFTETPTIERDVLPMLEVLRKVNPNIVSVALDPEASGPDTHYKVLQVMSEALRLYEQESGRSDIQVWGYRNVWYRYHPSEADIIIPVSLNMFAVMENSFMNAFLSQKDASFPSYEHDGPFSELAQKIQVDQYHTLKICLGREYFNEHPSPLIRATRGLVFLKSLTLAEFYERSRALRRSTENL
ncbi:MAG: glucosamine-6-phosphate deaminase [candidate division KSB1 bacterium]|nr:glucosamine-6-phosphate deaminase [candidate division KSB1 bacterium]MDZ7367458.1 glucosamine-6-phosphate deaminase [candidate division KSB1 bacterium]MDZ7405437.1 glucosamine-6-phosphate deaminase [candidate division KSB1 bacterium]